MQNVIATSVLILLCNNYFAKGNDECPDIETDGSVKVVYDPSRARAEFQCHESWYLMVPQEAKTSYCVLGRWTPPAPKCEVQCKIPRNPKNGKAHYNGLKPGSKLSYNCSEKFVLSERDTRICTRSGRWSHKDPVCIASACEKPADPHKGKASYESLNVGAKLVYECDDGFFLQANVVRECTPQGTWSGDDPHCEEIVCDDPVKPKGGKVELTDGDKRIGSTAKFSCQPGTTLFGSNSTTCEEDGEWDSDAPICIKDCDRPPPIDRAIVSKDTKEPYSVNSTVSYECTRGYVSRGGNARSVCEIHSETKKSVWTRPVITCDAISCGNPGNVQDGRRQGDDFTYPNSVVYTCNEGYRLHGKSTLDCQDNGRWNNKIPSCKALLCDIPRNPSKGNALYDNVEFGSKVKYVCDDGFSLNHDVERTCLSNGLWSGQEPICEDVVCNYPEIPVGGKAYLKDGDRRYGSTVDFECDPGKTLVGSPTLTCLKSGQWSSDSPRCLESCTVPIIQNGSLGLGGFALAQEVAVGTTVDHGKELILKCNQGFESQNPQSSVTKLTCEDGKWSSELQCNPAHCQNAPPTLVNGDIVKYDEDHDSVAVYKCDNNYKLVDKGIIVCKYGTWIGKLPVCEDARCYTKSLRNISGLILDPKEYFSSGEAFTPSCNDEYEISDADDVKIYCIEGEWAGNLTPCTEKIVCGNLEAPSEGNIQMIGGRGTVGSSAVFTCNPGRKLVGNSTSKCTESGEWTSEPPECLKPCTVPLLVSGSIRTFVKNGSFIYFQEGASVEAGTELIFRCNRKYYLPNNNDTEFRITCKKGQLPSDLKCTPEKCHDAPPAVMNGYIEHFEDKHNGVVVYKCNNFFSFEDIGSIACDLGIWKGKLPVCKYTRCYMRSLSNTPGLLIDEKRIFDSGESFTPQCIDSYEVSKQGDGKIYCDEGEWTGNILPCEETSCTEPPPEPENGKAIKYTGENGTAVVYRCEDSFVMEQNSIVECLYRNWEGTPPICKDTRCHMKTLSKYPGTLVDEKRFIFNGQSFTPECISGYQISWNGNGRIYCNEGEWTGSLPPCKEEMCTVPFVPNGSIGEDEKLGRFINFKKVSEGTAVEHGAELTFRCDVNYELVDNQNAEQKITCNKGKWSPDLQCTPAHCRKDPPGILNGYVEEFEETHNSAASYECNNFYRLIGNGSIVCQFGSWKGNLPMCEDTRCYTKSLKDLAGLSQDVLSQRDFFSTGESFAPTCTEMYEVSTQDDVNIYCTDGEWTGNLPPCTERIVCSDPEVPVGGKVEVIGGKRTVGSSAVFTCNPGRRLVGSSTSMCLDTGHWSSATPQCLKPCTVPLVLHGSFGLGNNGNMMYFQEVAAQTNVEPGTELLFRCEGNYDIENQDNSELKVICRNENLPADLKCIPAKCRDAPPPLSNGFIERFEDSHKGEVIYKCNEFFKLEDNGSVECQLGNWKGKLPICKDVRCYMNTLSNVPGLLINQKEFLHNGQSFLPKCTDTYEVSKKGNGKIYCTNGEWTGNLPPCEEKGCKDPPPEPENGEALQYTGIHGTSVVYGCNMWHKMEEDYKVECLNRRWIGTPPICRETRCFMRSLSQYSGILIDQQDFALSGQSLTPKCDDGYGINGQGDFRIYCIEGQWSGNLPPCKEADCVDPPPEPENGKAMIYTGKHGTSVTYECNEHFFTEDPSSNVECFLGKWKGKTPICKDTRCYLKNLKNNEGVQLEDDSPTMPNEKALVTCEQGYIMTFSPPTCLRGEWKNMRFSPCQQAGCRVEMVENGVTKLLKRNVKERPNVKLKDDDFSIVDVESWKNSGADAFVFCEPPNTFHGRGDPGYAKITCEKGKWRPLPLCLLTEITPTTIVTTNPPCECIYNNFDSTLVANLDERPLKYGDKVPSGFAITFRCTDTDNYRLTSPREILCENCGWYSAFPVCEEIERRLMCPEISQDESIIIQYNGKREVGSTANFWCMKIESERRGPERVTCLPTGQWSEKPPTCRDILCPEIPRVPFMSIAYEGNRQINSIARFQCKIPESQRIGPHFVTCEPTGKWSGRPPTCIGFCPEFEEDESLIITYHGERHINSTTSFRCKDPEFQRVGPAFVTCLLSGQWSNNPPKCEEIFCPEIAVDNSVRVIYNGDRKIYSTTRFLCTNPKTEINGPITVSCLQNGMWSQEPPTCEYLVCSEIAVDGSVQVTYSDDRKIESTASFHCTNPDTEVIGPLTVSCLQDGKWSEAPPTCEQLFCPEIAVDNSLQVTYNDDRKIRSTASFHCTNPDTELISPVTVSCLQNGKWSEEPPICKHKFCPEIIAENLVQMTYNGERKIYSTVSFQCTNPNTKIVGPVTASCLQNGKWSKEPPTCEYVLCPEMLVEDSVKIIYNAARNIYSTASFQCRNPNSEIVGPVTASCLQNGKWSHAPPTCKYIFCPEIPVADSVRVIYNANRNIYSTASFTCANSESKINGPRTVSCEPSGEWSEKPPTCENLFCPEIEVSDGVEVIYNSQREIYSTASFRCSSPEQAIVGPTFASCQPSGMWSENSPTCKYIFCPEIPVADSVRVIYNANRNIYSTASFTCANSESKINGPRTVSCEPSGEWSEKPPTCENIFCPEIPVADSVRVIYNANRNIYSTASFTCANSESKINGLRTVSCEPSGEWSEKPPTCETKFCPEIVTDDSIVVTYTSNRQPFSRAEFRCSDPDMVISGVVQVTCLLTGKWSQPVPTCKRKDGICGELKCPDLHGTALPTTEPIDFLCPEIETDDLVRVIYTSKRRLYSKAEFHCLVPDMEISGFVRVSCLSTGKWSEPAPTCQISACGPGAVTCQDGSCVESDNRCDGNNDCPDGRDENGCDAECPEILPRNGLTISYKPNRQIRGKARFQCTYPLQRIGKETIKCLPTRKWSAPIPSCYPISVVCFVKTLVDQLQANIELADKEQTLDKVLLDSEVHLKCHKALRGEIKSAKATCETDGKWKIGNCVSGCVPFKKPGNSRLIINNEKTSYVLGNSLTFTCPEGQHLTSALQRVLCLNGGWSHTTLPDCEDIGASLHR